jgi:cytidylate kinase
MQITIAGPAASGKGTIARRFARQFGFIHIDAGLVFRAFSFLRVAESEFLHRVTYDWHCGRATVFLDGREVQDQLLTQSAAEDASRMAADPGTFLVMARIVDAIARRYDTVIVDGRSAGTAILTDAEVKFYFHADLSVRARRRALDERMRGVTTSLRHVSRAIQERDERDQARTLAPLVVPVGAFVVDTTHLTAGEVVILMSSILARKGFCRPVGQ